MFAWLKKLFEPKPAAEAYCPVCGYLCIGKGGVFCIDKPTLVKIEEEERGES